METENLNPTGQAAALKTAYDAVNQILEKTPAMLEKENYGVNLPTLRRVKRCQPIKPVTYAFYMRLFMRMLLEEYQRRIQKGDTGREILRVLAEIALQEHNMNLY